MTIWEEEFEIFEQNSQTLPEFLHLWNQNVIPWMEERGNDYKRVAHGYAKSKGLEFDKSKHAYVIPWIMQATSGKNLIGVGWEDGVLRLAFSSKTGPRFYRSEPGVPREIALKLCRSPYPDNLYAQIVRGKYEMERE